MKKRNLSLQGIILEIIIVIIGISIAFWLNNWGEERKERALEVEYMKAWRGELASDSTIFLYQIERTETQVEHLQRFCDILRAKEYDNDSIPWFVGMFLNRNNWIVNSNTYETLKNSGKLDIISDFEFRAEISLFYRIRTLQTEEMLNLVQRFSENHMDKYLTQNTDYFISNSPDNSFVRDTEFQNLLALWTELHAQKGAVYKETVNDITHLISKLDAYLEEE